jgi:DNA invertase Pin-like site-specific DNA recombinase
MAKRSKAKARTDGVGNPIVEGSRRVVAYLRVSSQEQVRSGLGLAAQKEQIALYAKLHGLEVAGVCRDDGVSGSKKPRKRPGLSKALEGLRAGTFTGLLVARLDRLSRSCLDVSDITEEGEKRGFAILSVNEGLDTSTASGRMFARGLANMAQFERDMIRDRTKDALLEVGKQGRLRSGKPPMGWRLVVGPDSMLTNPPIDPATGEPMRIVADDREAVREAVLGSKLHLAPEPNERRLVRRMVKLRDLGNGPRKIANELNARKRDQNPRTGEPWTHTTIWHVLRSYDHRKAQGLA